MEWYRETAREGETSRIRTSSGSYTVIGNMTSAGKQFTAYDSANNIVAVRATQRDAKAECDRHSADRNREAAAAMRKPVVETTDGVDRIRDAFDKAFAVLDEVNRTGVAPTDDPSALLHRIIRRVQYDTLLAVRKTGVLYAEHAIAEVAEELSLPLPEGDPVPDPSPAFYATALREVDRTVAGWVEGAMSNHDALGHRGESEPCWHTFHRDDIRNMIKDTARTLGVPGVVE